MKIKLASYNIMSGGFRNYDPSLPSPERLPLIQKAIQQINADFVGLIDTYRWDELFTQTDLKKLFGFKNIFTINLEDQSLKEVGRNNGIVVLTNLNVHKFQKIRLYDRNAILTKIKAGKKVVNIFSIYLNHASEDIRLKQVEDLLKINKKENTIIHGDLNSFSPQEFGELKKNISEFFLAHSKYEKQYSSMLKEMLKGQVINTLTKSNLIDLATNSDKTAPTPLFGKNILPILRLDYFFATQDINHFDYRVHYGELFDQASDHYPISITISAK